MTITLTGIDEATDLNAISALLRQGAEIGILLSASPEGRQRYPSREWIDHALRFLAGSHLGGVALHVCGSRARTDVLAGGVLPWGPFIKRMQINGMVDPDVVRSLLKLYPAIDIITQHTPANAWTTCAAMPTTWHQVLIDASGGRGISPDGWEGLEITKDVGFAGGLGPKNLRTALPRILDVARSGWWIDMESSLRDEHDRFDVMRAAEAFEIATEIMMDRIPF